MGSLQGPLLIVSGTASAMSEEYLQWLSRAMRRSASQRTQQGFGTNYASSAVSNPSISTTESDEEEKENAANGSHYDSSLLQESQLRVNKSALAGDVSSMGNSMLSTTSILGGGGDELQRSTFSVLGESNVSRNSSRGSSGVIDVPREMGHHNSILNSFIKEEEEQPNRLFSFSRPPLPPPRTRVNSLEARADDESFQMNAPPDRQQQQQPDPRHARSTAANGSILRSKSAAGFEPMFATPAVSRSSVILAGLQPRTPGFCQEEPSEADSAFKRQVEAMNTEQLLQAAIPVLEMNMPAQAIEHTLKSLDNALRKLLIQNEYRVTSDKKKQTAAEFVHKLHEFNTMSVPAQKKTLVMLRVALERETEQWVNEFVDSPGFSEGGMKLLSKVIAITLNVLAARNESDPECRDYIGVLTEAVRSARAIVNTYSGLAMILRKDMNLHLQIIQVLALLTTRTFRQPEAEEESGYGQVGGALQTAGVAEEMAEARQLRAEIIKLVSGIAMDKEKMVEKLEAEMTGARRLLEDLASVGRKLGKNRFRPIIHAYARSTTDYESMYRLTVMVNMILGSQGHMDLTDEQAWQARAHIRNELMRDGLAAHVEYMTKLLSSPKRQEESPDNQEKLGYMGRALEAFVQLKENDFKELIGRFENLKGDYDTLEGCCEMLRSTTLSTVCENPLLSILQHLMMVTDDLNTRNVYFRLIESCVSEIVLHRSDVDPDFNSRFHFESNVADMIETMENAEASKRLEAAAISVAYWAKLKEFEEEAKKLRLHISDPKVPLPPATACSLKPPSSTDGGTMPSTSGANGLPPVTGGSGGPPPLPVMCLP